ncbi:MAG TPA: hypothetical protein VKS81_09520 [Bacteroidota bacterium]|nr:hypothetical protein [Bacteroidota bacterium]
MSVLLVNYDQEKMDPKNEDPKNKESRNEIPDHEDPVLDVVNTYEHVRLAEGEYAIETGDKTRTVLNKIVPHLKKNVHLLIVTLTKPFASTLPEPLKVWLRKHLPEA